MCDADDQEGVFQARALLLVTWLHLAAGHGYLADPPSRSSMWKFGFNTPINWDLDELNCGGFGTQWDMNVGQCGECGDAYNLPRPRPNEFGGRFGLGIVSRNYTAGHVIDVTVILTSNHGGWFEFRLCPHPLGPVEQSCLDRHILSLPDGHTKYALDNFSPGARTLRIQLPYDVTCERCVLQWHWTTGNSWGRCENGTEGMGCGQQETWRNCADVAIFPWKYPATEHSHGDNNHVDISPQVINKYNPPRNIEIVPSYSASGKKYHAIQRPPVEVTPNTTTTWNNNNNNNNYYNNNNNNNYNNNNNNNYNNNNNNNYNNNNNNNYNSNNNNNNPQNVHVVPPFNKPANVDPWKKLQNYQVTESWRKYFNIRRSGSEPTEGIKKYQTIKRRAIKKLAETFSKYNFTIIFT